MERTTQLATRPATDLSPERGPGPLLAAVELRLESFQGPLGLLLSLIEQRKLPITSVSLAAVADQYLAHMRAMPALDADMLSDFLLVAAKLLLIKSRAILPGQEEPTEEEDPAEELAARLQEYRLFRAAAQYLQTLEQREGRCYPHPPRAEAVPIGPTPLEPVAPAALALVLRQLLARQLRQPAQAAEVQRLVRASVEARMALISELLEASTSVAWDRIAGQSVDEVVATFLALLEMLKRGLAVVEQEGIFGPIVVRRPLP